MRARVIQAHAAIAHGVDVIGLAVRQAADRRAALRVVDQRIAGVQAVIGAERDRLGARADHAGRRGIEVQGRREREALVRTRCARAERREPGVAAGERMRFVVVEAQAAVIERKDEVRVAAGQAADRRVTHGVVGHLVAGLQAGLRAEEDAVRGDVDDRVVVDLVLRMQDAVLGGARVHQRIDLRLRIADALVVGELGCRELHLVVHVEHRRIGLPVTELPVGLVLLLLRRDEAVDYRLHALLIAGGVGELQVIPHAGEELRLGARVDVRVGVRVEQAAG